MSQSPPPPPPTLPAGPPPFRKKCCPGGCAPIFVFLLAVICAGSLVALRCGCTLRTEDGGRVVMEFLEQNSKEEMKAHRKNAMSSGVLDNAVKRLNLVVENELRTGTPGSGKVHEDVRDRLLRNMQVDVDGRFLTITVYEKEQSPAALVNAVAAALDEDIKAVRETRWRTFSQNREARIRMHTEMAEKARLEWLDHMVKTKLDPAQVAAAEAQEAEMRARLAKVQAEFVMLEARLGTAKDGDASKEQLLAEVESVNAVKKAYEIQVQKGTEESTRRILRQSEYQAARAGYDLQLATLQKLREENIAAQIAEGVVQRPTRIVDEARAIDAPDRKARRRLQLAAVISGILLAASLLASLTRFLRRL